MYKKKNPAVQRGAGVSSDEELDWGLAVRNEIRRSGAVVPEGAELFLFPPFVESRFEVGALRARQPVLADDEERARGLALSSPTHVLYMQSRERSRKHRVIPFFFYSTIWRIW